MRVFQEVQRFNQWWLQLINIALLAFLLFCIYNWYIAKESTGNVMATDSLGQLIVMGTIIPVLILFSIMKLKTSINETGVHYRFVPFQFSSKTIRWYEMEKCYVRTYSAIKEYGGWGYRTTFSKKGKAYNVRGNKGIQIEFKTGKKNLIGTQKEDNASQVIKRYIHHKA